MNKKIKEKLKLYFGIKRPPTVFAKVGEQLLNITQSKQPMPNTYTIDGQELLYRLHDWQRNINDSHAEPIVEFETLECVCDIIMDMIAEQSPPSFLNKKFHIK